MFAAGAIDGPVSLSPTQTRVYHGSPIFKSLSKTSASTMSARAPLVLHRTFRTSGRALSSIERELSSGFCEVAIDRCRTELRDRRRPRRAGEPRAGSARR